MDEMKKIKLILDGGEITIRTCLDLSLMELLIKHNPDVKYFIVQRYKVML